MFSHFVRIDVSVVSVHRLDTVFVLIKVLKTRSFADNFTGLEDNLR